MTNNSFSFRARTVYKLQSLLAGAVDNSPSLTSQLSWKYDAYTLSLSQSPSSVVFLRRDDSFFYAQLLGRGLFLSLYGYNHIRQIGNVIFEFCKTALERDADFWISFLMYTEYCIHRNHTQVNPSIRLSVEGPWAKRVNSPLCRLVCLLDRCCCFFNVYRRFLRHRPCPNTLLFL